MSCQLSGEYIEKLKDQKRADAGKCPECV